MLNGWLPPVFTRLITKLSRNGLVSEENEVEEQVYAEYDEQCGVVFFPPVHAQRYAAVCDCLMDERWFGKLEKVLNIGRHCDINFMKYLTEVPGIEHILCLDIEYTLNCTCDMPELLFDDYGQNLEKPLQITLLQGNAADPDYRLMGCNAVIGIEMIEQLLPHDLDRLVHNVFGFIKPWIVIFTTPNADFNHFMKNLDKNRLRQLDHYFEWTRAQLHDWCSNIVERYPEYTVVSRGVGPGPAGTSHCGCYSQLVLFVSMHYKKEMELNVNSLVLVSDLPEPDDVRDIVWTTETSDLTSSPSLLHMIEDDGLLESDRSDSTIEDFWFPSPSSSGMTFSHQHVDKSCQCNLDAELSKGFVMFNYEEMYELRMPRKRIAKNVYEIGDVASRLNNTMYEVKQFSEATQCMLEKNEMYTSNSQDMMKEISHLTKKLTVNTNHSAGEGCIWNNVNWGENVPYWNQYYKVVGVYIYPYEFQKKSEDEMIVDLLLKEINKHLGKQELDGLRQGNLFEIHIKQLMDAVKHITDDIERVVNLMEDNGYELDGELLVRPSVDVSDFAHEDLESRTDIDTNESMSNESSFGQEFNGRLLSRRLDCKLKKLQSVVPNGEELRQALGHVVCRLKKLALSCGQDKQGPARSKWLESKLFDLLNMTEKSILRKKMRNIELDPLKGLGYDTGDETASHLTKIKAEDDTAVRIVEKYQNILRMSTDNVASEQTSVKQLSNSSDITDGTSSEDNLDRLQTYKFTDDSEKINSSDNEKELYEEIMQESEVHSVSINKELRRYLLNESETDSVQDWEEKDMSIYENTYDSKNCKDMITFEYSTHIKSQKKNYVKDNLRFTKKYKMMNRNIICNKKPKYGETGSYTTVKNMLKYTYSCKALGRKKIKAASEKKVMRLVFDNMFSFMENNNKMNTPKCVLSMAPNPIPDDLIELCHPELSQKTYEHFKKISDLRGERKNSAVSAPQDSQKIEILTQTGAVTVALQRMVGTNPDVDPEVYQHELEQSELNLLTEASSYEICTFPPCSEPGHSYKDTPRVNKFFEELNPDSRSVAVTEAAQIVEILTQDDRELVALQRTVGTSPCFGIEVCEKELEYSKLTSSLDEAAPHEKARNEPFFLYDINEPTTSKGLRRVSMDVQCGTDAKLSNCAMLSPKTSFTTPFKVIGTGIKTEDSIPDAVDCVTSTHDILGPCGPTSSLRMKSVGIKIKDSCHQIEDSLLNDDNERETVFGPFSDVKNAHIINTTRNNSNEIGSLHPDPENYHRLENTTANISDLLTAAVDNNLSTDSTYRLETDPDGIKIFSTKSPESLRVVMRYLRLPHEMRPTLSCGGVQVHSYRNLRVSEDVVYQGEWQRYRQKPHRKNLGKHIDFSTYKSKYTRKINIPTQPEKTRNNRPNTAPITIRNTKASKLKENVTEINMENNIIDTKSEGTKSQPKKVPKVTSKLAGSYSKSIKENSKTAIQSDRQKILPHTYKGKENEISVTQKQNTYVPPYSKKHQNSKIPNNTRVKSDSLTNLLKLNNEDITITSQSRVEELMSALLKVSVECPGKVSYFVYRNETETSKCSTAVEKIPVSDRPSDRENVLRRNLSDLSRDGSACSSHTCMATVNPQPAARQLKTRRKPLIKTSSITRKGSDSKLLSRIKKLASKVMTTRHSNVTNIENLPGTSTSTLSKPGSKHQVEVNLALKPNIKKSFVKSCHIANESGASDKSKERSNAQDSKTVLLQDPLKTKNNNQALMDAQDSVTSPSKGSLSIVDNTVMDPTNFSHITADYSNNIYDVMKQIIEESLHFINTPERILSNDTERTNLRCYNFENFSSSEFDTYTTSDSYQPSYDVCLSPNQTQSITDISLKSVSFDSKISECFADNESCSNVSRLCDNGSNVEGIYEGKETLSLTQKPMAGVAFSTFSVDADLTPVVDRQQPDYVNLVDSETGSYAVAATRLATSEELLLSGHTSQSYVSCTLDEEGEIPSWLFHNLNQQASGSIISSQRPFELSVEGSEMPEPFALRYDENGNELSVLGAGAGDGRGIHSDQSQDSSGQGTSLSSTAASSSLQSESIVVEPATFVAELETSDEQANTSNAASVLQNESIGVSSSAIENPNSPSVPNHVPWSMRRVSLPASDADISSIDTDVVSDN